MGKGKWEKGEGERERRTIVKAKEGGKGEKEMVEREMGKGKGGGEKVTGERERGTWGKVKEEGWGGAMDRNKGEM